MVSVVRRAPKWTEIPQYPVIAGTAALAIAVTIAWWFKVDISPLFATAMIRRERTLAIGHLHPASPRHSASRVQCLLALDFRKRRRARIWTSQDGRAHRFVRSRFGRNGIRIRAWRVGLSGVVYGLFGLLWVLSPRDERFHDVVDRRTVQLFVLWFAFCVFTTLAHILPVANIAHAAGAVLGVLVGFAVIAPDRRALAATGIAVILCVGLWGSTLGRPRINLSGKAGYQEGNMGLRRSHGKPQPGSCSLAGRCGKISAEGGHLLVRPGHRLREIGQ